MSEAALVGLLGEGGGEGGVAEQVQDEGRQHEIELPRLPTTAPKDFQPNPSRNRPDSCAETARQGLEFQSSFAPVSPRPATPSVGDVVMRQASAGPSTATNAASQIKCTPCLQRSDVSHLRCVEPEGEGHGSFGAQRPHRGPHELEARHAEDRIDRLVPRALRHTPCPQPRVQSRFSQHSSTAL